MENPPGPNHLLSSCSVLRRRQDPCPSSLKRLLMHARALKCDLPVTWSDDENSTSVAIGSLLGRSLGSTCPSPFLESQTPGHGADSLLGQREAGEEVAGHYWRGHVGWYWICLGKMSRLDFLDKFRWAQIAYNVGAGSIEVKETEQVFAQSSQCGLWLFKL